MIRTGVEVSSDFRRLALEKKLEYLNKKMFSRLKAGLLHTPGRKNQDPCFVERTPQIDDDEFFSSG